MTKNRLEAFSDGVLAIIITIMVLELKLPEGTGWPDLWHERHGLMSYVLSFVYLGIYWNNHHHLLHTVHRVNGRILWANMHLLFWLSLTPFVTAWTGETDFATFPTAMYGVVLLLSAIAYYVLQSTILASEGPHSKLARAVGVDKKGKMSPFLYIAGIAGSFIHPAIGGAFYAFVALIWLVPDKRIERILNEPV